MRLGVPSIDDVAMCWFEVKRGSLVEMRGSVVKPGAVGTSLNRKAPAEGACPRSRAKDAALRVVVLSSFFKTGSTAESQLGSCAAVLPLRKAGIKDCCYLC